MTAAERFLIGFLLAAILFLEILDVANAAKVEVSVNASRDGWARLYAEGIQVGTIDGCATYCTSRGERTTRRVRVHKGTNHIRLKAFRWEDMDAYEYAAKYRPFAPDVHYIPAAWPVVSMPFNWVRVEGRVAGREIEPKEIKIR